MNSSDLIEAEIESLMHRLQETDPDALLRLEQLFARFRKQVCINMQAPEGALVETREDLVGLLEDDLVATFRRLLSLDMHAQERMERAIRGVLYQEAIERNLH